MTGQSSEEVSVAVVALAVALCAFIITFGQLLRQYYATTADIRKCQSSLGPWAKRTRLRWRWTQCRFETLFTTPRLFLTPLHFDRNQERVALRSIGDDMEHITGSPDSRIRTMSVVSHGENRSIELASWLPFLESLHRNEWKLQEYDCFREQLSPSRSHDQQHLFGPALRFHEMSCDSTPLGIVRPIAVTTLSEIAIMARRLGMSWQAFDPVEGIMRAEGNGHAISSTRAASTALVLQYLHIDGTLPWSSSPFSPEQIPLSKADFLIPTREADKMGFGILPGCERLQIPDFKVGTIDEVCATMKILDPTRKISRKLRDMRNFQIGLKWEHPCTFGFSDIIALATPMIRGRLSSITRVPRPAEYCSSLLSQKEGFVVFRNRLKEYLSEHSEPSSLKRASWILQQYEGLKRQFSEWENEAFDRINDCNWDFLDEVHDRWDDTTTYFVHLQDTNQLNYRDLMTSHIAQALKYWGDAWNNVKAGKARDKLGMRAVEVEGMHLYFDYLPLLVADMRTKGFDGPERLVHEAWFTLMFRALCWGRCHSCVLEMNKLTRVRSYLRDTGTANCLSTSDKMTRLLVGVRPIIGTRRRLCMYALWKIHWAVAGERWSMSKIVCYDAIFLSRAC